MMQTMKGSDGVWRQIEIGFSGDWENSGGVLEVPVAPEQEELVNSAKIRAQKGTKRGTKSAGRSQRRRRRRK